MAAFWWLKDVFLVQYFLLRNGSFFVHFFFLILGYEDDSTLSLQN